MNNLVEQVVKKEKDARYYINLGLIIFAVVAIPATFVILAYFVAAYLIYVALFMLIFCAYGAWFMITSLRVEYEYGFLLSTLRIDRIINKRKRKPVVKVDVKILEDFFPYSDKEMSAHKFTKVYRAAASEFSTDNYVASYHSEAKGRVAIIFTPNKELIEAMKPYFSNELRRKLFLEHKL